MASSDHLLEIQTGKHKGRRVKLAEQEVVIGRGEQSKIRVASSEVSREHCLLIPQAEGILVRDLNSSNGTFIDGRPIPGEKLLLPGSTLTVGPMTFLLVGAPAEARQEEVRVAVAGKSAVDPSLSDDDIASWLSSDELPVTSTSETAILKASKSMQGRLSTAEIPARRKEGEAASRKREFKTVADEAQDIIRRHFETAERQQPDEFS